MTSKKYSIWISRLLSPRYGQVVLVSGCLVLIDHNIDVQSVFSWAPWASKVARKCESKHWYACGADGRTVGRCTVM